ncbi:MAG: Fic family protein [Longimicrobiaceae bacterium]
MPSLSNAEISRQLAALNTLLQAHPEGISLPQLIDEYASRTGERLARRTMLRRLTQLAVEGRVGVEGSARATQYRPLVITLSPGVPRPAERVEAAGAGPGRAPEVSVRPEPYIPLSPEGEEVRALVRRPISARTPVGYDPEFLERYEPGVTWYLPEATRVRLHELGRTDAAERPAGTYARQIYEQLLLDLSWASSRLEGNTYTRLDTKELLRWGREPEGKDIVETQMILNHRAAIELLVEQAEDVGFNRWTFFGLHAALSENLVGDRRNEGGLRRQIVGIGGTTYTPLGIPQKVEEQFDRILEKAGRIPDPFEQAFFVMVHLPYLQPFIDVNKRTSRLGANLPLIKANLCPLSFVDVPEGAYVDGTLGVYELNRVELLRDVFVWAYERSCAQYAVVREAFGKPDPFRLAYREQLRVVVRDMVQRQAPPDASELEAWGARHGIAADDLPRFVDAARAELLDLHEGSLQRYHLLPSEFEAWRRSVIRS